MTLPTSIASALGVRHERTRVVRPRVVGGPEHVARMRVDLRGGGRALLEAGTLHACVADQGLTKRVGSKVAADDIAHAVHRRCATVVDEVAVDELQIVVARRVDRATGVVFEAAVRKRVQVVGTASAQVGTDLVADELAAVEHDLVHVAAVWPSALVRITWVHELLEARARVNEIDVVEQPVVETEDLVDEEARVREIAKHEVRVQEL